MPAKGIYLRLGIVCIQKAVRDELWTQIHDTFRKAKLHIVPQLESIGVHKTSVRSLVDGTFAVIPCSAGCVIYDKKDRYERILWQRFKKCNLSFRTVCS